MGIPHVRSALFKERKTPPSCLEIEQPVVSRMKSFQLLGFPSWRMEVTISHSDKEKQCS